MANRQDIGEGNDCLCIDIERSKKEMAKSGGVLYQSATSPCTGWVELRWQ